MHVLVFRDCDKKGSIYKYKSAQIGVPINLEQSVEGVQLGQGHKFQAREYNCLRRARNDNAGADRCACLEFWHCPSRPTLSIMSDFSSISSMDLQRDVTSCGSALCRLWAASASSPEASAYLLTTIPTTQPSRFHIGDFLNHSVLCTSSTRVRGTQSASSPGGSACRGGKNVYTIYVMKCPPSVCCGDLLNALKSRRGPPSAGSDHPQLMKGGVPYFRVGTGEIYSSVSVRGWGLH